jgi:hypothetical protein
MEGEPLGVGGLVQEDRMSATGRGPRLGGVHDNFPTPFWCVHRLLDAAAVVPSGLIGGPGAILPAGRWLEPGAGSGAILRAVATHQLTRGHVSWDAIEIRKDAEGTLRRSADFVGQAGLQPRVQIADFLEAANDNAFFELRECSVVIGNPSYAIAEKVVRRSLELCPHAVVAMLLRLNFYGGEERSGWMSRHIPDAYVLPNRPSFRTTERLDEAGKKRKSSSDACEYAWCVWPPGAGRFERRRGSISLLGPTDLATRKTDRVEALGWEAEVAAA